MTQNNQIGRKASPQRGILSVKVISILFVGLLVAGTVPVTHSYPSAKANISNIWLAARNSGIL